MTRCSILLTAFLVPFLVGCATRPASETPATALPPPTATPAPPALPTLAPSSTPEYRVINPENQHRYLLANFAAGWHEAHAYCSSLGAHLVTIQSAQENQFVARLAPEMWLGATDETQEGVWGWVTGESWNYSSWYPGEPNNCCPPQHCGPQECTPENYLTTDDTGRWNDTPDGQMFFVCEWERSP